MLIYNNNNDFNVRVIFVWPILGDPGADSGGKGKSKRAEKYGTKKSKERRKEPLGIMSYQTSSKQLPPFCLLIGQKSTKVFWHQSEVRTAATDWNWSGKTLSLRGLSRRSLLFFVPYFSARLDFPSPPLSPLGLWGCVYDLEMKTPEQNNFKTSYKENKRDLEHQRKEVTRMI